MKKLSIVFLALLLILGLALGLSACNGNGGTGDSGNTGDNGNGGGGDHVHTFDQKNTADEYKRTEASCYSGATYFYSCACGAKGTDSFESGDPVHTFDQKNTTSAYLKSEATNDDPAYYYYSCTCGAKGTDTFIHGDALKNTLELIFAPTADYSFYTVTGVTGKGAVLEIPNLHDGLRVVAIADGAFEGNTGIRKIILPNTVETVGANAFKNCTALAEVELPEDSVALIGAYAFAGCTALESISIPATVEALPTGAFQGCTALRSATLANGLKTVGDLAFDGCTALTAIVLPDTVTTLGNMTFRHAEALASVKFSAGLNAIGNATFQYCKKLASVELHAGITALGNSSFSYCSDLRSLKIMGSIASFGNSTFYECTALSSVYFDQSSAAAVPPQNYIFYNAGTAGIGIAFSSKCNVILPELLFVPNDAENLPKILSRTALHNFDTANWTADDEHRWHACLNLGCTSAKDKTAHTFGEWIVDDAATCVKTGTRHHICTVCQRSVSETYTDASAHNYATTWTTDGGETHWQVCLNSGCTSISGKTTHTYDQWKVDKAATCMEAGTRHKTCICGIDSINDTSESFSDPTAHNYSTAWTAIDNTYHGHKCQNSGCDSISGKAAHSATDGRCTVCYKITTYYRDGNYIYFGEYPQTMKADSVTVTSTTDSRGYYLGSDGFYYAKVTADPYPYGGGYTFSTGTSVKDGTVYYFKVAPIRWRILSEDGDTALILCDSIIANKRFDDSKNNYKDSEIRAWLNDQFYNTAFNALQKDLINTVLVDNSAASTGYDPNPYACEDTSDKVFLLSYKEVTNTAYGFASGGSAYDTARRMTVSDYARATGAWMVTSSDYYGNGRWWLRSTNYYYDGIAREVLYDGDAVRSSKGVGSDDNGVVPALQIRLR